MLFPAPSDETPGRSARPGVLLLEVGTFRLREPFSDQEAPMDANSGAPWSEADIAVQAGSWCSGWLVGRLAAPRPISFIGEPG
jgi:hypothetical protein